MAASPTDFGTLLGEGLASAAVDQGHARRCAHAGRGARKAVTMCRAAAQRAGQLRRGLDRLVRSGRAVRADYQCLVHHPSLVRRKVSAYPGHADPSPPLPGWVQTVRGGGPDEGLHAVSEAER